MINPRTTRRLPRPIILTSKHLALEDDCACPDSPLIFTDTQDSFENDCACPTMEGANSVQSSEDLLYKQTADVYIDSLPQNFRLAFSPYAPGGPSVLNTQAWERWQSFKQPQPLTQPADHLFAGQNLVLPVNTRPCLQLAHPETLTVWLHITNACNLNCSYCYVRKSSNSMSKTTGRKTIKRIFQTAQKHHFKNIKIKYAGGEPTLKFGLIKKLSAQAQSLSKDSGINLQQVILSNGTNINPQDAEWIVENNVRLMISVDGLDAIHDKMRPFSDGRGSFQIVGQTIDKVLLPNGVAPLVTITITQQNAADVADVVRWALKRDLQISLNFYRHKPNSLLDLAAEENALINGMLSTYKVYEEMLPIRPFLNGLLDRVQVGCHLQTCGVGSSYLVINHEGGLTQCQMLLDNPIAANLKEDEDLFSLIAQGPIRNFSINQKTIKICQECILRYHCTGGCPLETFRASGDWDAPSPNCNIYRKLFPRALRLEGLRILKEHEYLI